MLENTSQKLVVFFLIALVFSSCGVISKARYGNGFSIHIENNWFGKNDVKKEKKIEKNDFQDSFSNTLLTQKTKVGPFENDVTPPRFQTVETIITQPNQGEENLSSSEIKLDQKSEQAIHTEKKSLKTIPRKVEFSGSTNQLEPNVAWALAFLILSIIVLIASNSMYIPFAGLIFTISLILSLTLAIVSLGKIKQSNGEYSGKGLAIFLIILITLFSVSVIYIYLLLLALL
jgi:hypothetical protein